MNRSRLEWKVGLFVMLSLGLVAALIMGFSKSTSLLTKTYEFLLTTANVGGIRTGATVLVAGVQVGTVRQIDLDDSGKSVTMHIQIQARFKIHKDARFTIEQAGFLGDQYISITPGENRAAVLQPGETVACEEPFNLQEVARSGASLLRRVDRTAARLDEAVARIDRTLLAEETLTNLAGAVGNFRVVSDRALNTLDGIDQLVQTNTPALTVAISNLVSFSAQLDQVTEELQLTIATNRVEITTAVQNVQTATSHLSKILEDLQAGKGLAGSILKDENLQREFASTVSNFNLVSSNLSQHGLLWKPRNRKAAPVASAPYPGKNPAR